MNKTEAIQKILEMIWSNKPAAKVITAMAESEVTPAEVTEALNKPKPGSGERFDLLIEEDGKPKRVAFEDGKDKNPKAIFPLNDFPTYLSLEETGMQLFPDLKDKERLMDEHLCMLIKPVRHELNDKLEVLGKAPLRGEYWLNGHELSGTGYWTVKFYEGEMKWIPREIEYNNPKHTAKVRYIGFFQN